MMLYNINAKLKKNIGKHAIMNRIQIKYYLNTIAIQNKQGLVKKSSSLLYLA